MAQRDWFRVGIGWTDDEDIDAVGLAAAGLWTHLCCLADRDGVLDHKAARVRLRRFPDFDEAWAALAVQGLVVPVEEWPPAKSGPEKWKIKGWDKHQFPMTNAERQQLWRDRQQRSTPDGDRRALERLGDLMKGRQ